jgi:hypothetical protein
LISKCPPEGGRYKNMPIVHKRKKTEEVSIDCPLPAACYLVDFPPLITLLMLTPTPQENVLNEKLMLRVYPRAKFR